MPCFLGILKRTYVKLPEDNEFSKWLEEMLEKEFKLGHDELRNYLEYMVTLRPREIEITLIWLLEKWKKLMQSKRQIEIKTQH